MLISFKLRNYRSFLNAQRFSFSSSADRSHETTNLMRTGMKAVPSVSRTAIVFGANASGKSNLLNAISTLRTLILRSSSISDAQFGELYTPFEFERGPPRPTDFEIDLVIDRVRYLYSVAYDAQRICAERLLVYRTGKSQRWFDRRYEADTDTEQWMPFSPGFNGSREIWRKATRHNALFLTTAAQLNSKQLAPLMHWMEHCVELVLQTAPSDYGLIRERLLDHNFKKRAVGLLRAVDINVVDIRVTEPPMAGAGSHQAMGDSGHPQINFLHKPPGSLPIWLKAEFEAAGARCFLKLLSPLLQAIDLGKLLMIDEFDHNLHPLIARYLIQLINDPTVSQRGAQLLLTSHNITLMDLELLRRDEIWLVELDDAESSNLAPLMRSSPRKHEHVARGYLRGRYGAVPAIQPALAQGALQQSDAEDAST